MSEASRSQANSHPRSGDEDRESEASASRSPSSSLSSFKPSRRLEEVRREVAREIAVRAFLKAETVDDVKVCVMMAFSNNDDADFLKLIATSIQEQMRLRTFLFAVATTGPTKDSATNYIAVCGSMNDFVHRAVLLASAKFMSRIDSVYSEDKLWIAGVKDYGSSSFDETALWDVVRKAARQPIDPLLPPPGSKGIDEILEETRAKLQRLTPQQAYSELQEPTVGAPTFLVDIRPAAQRAVEGSIYGSLIIERNVLEWRFDPRCSAKLNIADRYDLRIIIICQEGYTSSLAAYSLHQIGMLNATDIVGGYKAWKEAGLPVDVPMPNLMPMPTTEPEGSLEGSVI